MVPLAEPTRTVERALALLALVCERGSVSLVEGARAAELAPSTALRLLRTLETSGFATRDEDGTFRPGPRMIQLGAVALSSHQLVDISREPMRALAEGTGESAYLSIEGHGATAVYVAIHDGQHAVRHTTWVGGTIPLEGSAAGRALTGGVTSGYCVVADGVEPDVTALAAPVRSEGRVVAALSLVVPTYRLDETTVARHGRALVAAAQQISAQISRTSGDPVSRTRGEQPQAGAR